MTDETYTVYFSGEIVPDADPAQVRSNLARLFNADEQRIAQLFSGDRVVIKRGLDEAGAMKYQQAMWQAGAVCVAQPDEAAAPATVTPAEPIPDEAPAPTPGEASAASPTARAQFSSSDETVPDFSGLSGADAMSEPAEPVHDVPPAVAGGELHQVNVEAGALDMAEPGVQLVEHETVPEPDIDVAGLDMSAPGAQLAEHEEVPEPDIQIDGMSMAVPGEILAEPTEVPPADIDTSDLSLADDDERRGDEADPDRPPPNPFLTEP